MTDIKYGVVRLHENMTGGLTQLLKLVYRAHVNNCSRGILFLAIQNQGLNERWKTGLVATETLVALNHELFWIAPVKLFQVLLGVTVGAWNRHKWHPLGAGGCFTGLTESVSQDYFTGHLNK